MKKFKKLFAIASIFATLVTLGSATPAGDYNLPAAGGYDLVSYHQKTGPVRGSGFHTAEHKGITYLFKDAENKATFEASPEKYLPAYNGFCAYGVALGKKFYTDPTVYEVVDGILYLNLDSGIQEKWSEDISGNIAKADDNWKSMN